MLPAEVMEKVELLTPLLRRFPCSEYGIAVGGAHAKGIADSESDLDLYLFAAAIQPNEERSRLTRGFSPDIRDVLCWGNTDSFEQAGTDFFLRGLKVECWLRNSVHIGCVIGDCTEGILKRDFITWTTTGF